jgi:purine-nucleoside phosphorylase
MTTPEALRVLQSRAPFVPDLAIVLGSGLGALADSLEAKAGLSVSFTDIPGFPAPTVAGHGGQLVFCEFEGRKVVLQAGRFHFYEGHPMALVVTPMRLYGRLGVKAVLLTNAAGALNPEFGVGDLMALTDHINLFGTNPLIGPNVEPGPRFPDMTAIYDPAFRSHLLAADAVGMSTVPEAIVARQEGMRVAGISCLCNMAAGILPQALTHQEVLAAGAAAAGRFEALVRAFVRDLPI